MVVRPVQTMCSTRGGYAVRGMDLQYEDRLFDSPCTAYSCIGDVALLILHFNQSKLMQTICWSSAYDYGVRGAVLLSFGSITLKALGFLVPTKH